MRKDAESPRRRPEPLREESLTVERSESFNFENSESRDDWPEKKSGMNIIKIRDRRFAMDLSEDQPALRHKIIPAGIRK
ncbi:hypothetical protein CEXT_601621 [Caerostris extrusa]|uniref:Uncharacterized protein n=1 Tax=Caerostris extrusa TaxID=172846 RepID=A0AAV4PKK8_CAEEX|nr:hypothetical protein CEXT_601621 [Caerostris extrusa]